MSQSKTRAEQFFWNLTSRPLLTVVLGLLGIMAAAVVIPNLVKDTSLDAFIDDDNPAVVYRDKVREIFGLNGHSYH